jgi:hypothetical protein
VHKLLCLRIIFNIYRLIELRTLVKIEITVHMYLGRIFKANKDVDDLSND